MRSKMSKKSYLRARPILLVALLFLCCTVSYGEERARASGPLVKREQRSRIFASEDGEISAARVTLDDMINGSYLLHFFTLEPNSLFLPALLHADMVFYVHTGSGKLSWTEEGDLKSADLTRGDVYRLQEGSFFFVQSNLETQTERQKLRIHAMFADSNTALHAPPTGPYSSIRDIVLGFDREVLQAAFKVPKEVIDELVNGANQPAIVHGLPKTKKSAFQMEAQFLKSFVGSRGYNLYELNKKKKKTSDAKLFNLFKEDKDFENCNGWSTTVTGRKLTALRGSDVGLFMVNLTTGSMMGPHWNPTATEIAVVLQGRGMIQVVCSSFLNKTGCTNMRFEVEEGDVFAVPRFHPMAQISFNNDTLIFMGFSTSARRNHPQFLAGQASVFRSLDRDVLAMSFNVSNSTLDQLLAPQHESVILGCVSCAEEELRIMQEEMERAKEEAKEREKEESERVEEERRREEEEARRKEEAAAKKEEEERERREQEARKREEEERKRREEEGRERREEDERQREEAEARRKEKEEAAKREEEEARRREEESAEREERERERREEEERQREEARARRKEKEEAAKREEEEARRREEESAERERERREEEERQREEEEAEARQREEEKARRREEEAAKMEEQKAREREEEEEARRRHQEEEAEREEEGAWEREQEEEEARRRHQEEEEHGWRSEEERAAEEERRREERAAEEERRREERARRAEEEEERRVEEDDEEERQRRTEGENQDWGRIILKKNKRLTV